MATISQTITAIPEAGHRGVDARDTFVTKQEAFQDALQGTTVSQLNNFATQANAVRNEVNGFQSSAATSATNASNSAGAANTSAGAAATSASQAATARDEALNVFDNFDDRYLGSKAVNPTLDNDGGTLLEGALYWNTTVKRLRIWTGSAWQDTTNAVVSTDNAIVRFDGTNGAVQNSGVIIDDSNNVGVGTNSTGSRLHIKQPNDIYTGGLAIQSASDTNVRMYIGVDSTTTVISNDNRAMKIESTGNNPLTLGTNNTERMRIDASGNVGIGTSSPTAKQEIYDYDTNTNALTVTNASQLRLTNLCRASSGNGSLISFKNFNGTNSVYAGIAGWMRGSAASGAYGDLVFATKPDYATVDPIERMRIDSAGNVGIGTSSPLDALHIENSNGTKGITLNNTSGVGASGIVFKNSGTSNWTLQALADSSKAFRLYDYISSAERLRVDASGNLLLTSGTGALGYGTGAGGTVTQLTSKSTAVTLNKPSGEIVMNNATLASGATVAFTLNNSLIGVNDVLILSIGGTVVDYARYNAWSMYSGSGYTYIYLKNIYTSSLGEAVSIRFTIVKGANS